MDSIRTPDQVPEKCRGCPFYESSRPLCYCDMRKLRDQTKKISNKLATAISDAGLTPEPAAGDR